MKKVLIFSLNYYPHFIGGAEVAIQEITNRVMDIEFHMVTLRMDATLPIQEKIGNVIVHRIGPAVPSPTIVDLRKFPLHYTKHLYQFLAVCKAMQLHQKYRFKGIWAMMAHSCGIPAGLFKTFNRDVPYLLTLQEGDPPKHIEALAKPVWPLFKRGFSKADYLQPISNFLLIWGKQMGFKGDAFLIPNAVDTLRFSKTFLPGDVQHMKDVLKKKEGDVFLVTTSRLVHKNAIDDVIRAVPLMPPNVTFLIYGIGPEEEKLRILADTLSVSDRVCFMGQIGHAQMPLMLACCDIFTRPSRSEGMGNSFVEAMAAGLPVIATQEGGIADFLYDEKRNTNKRTTGWAVDVNDPQQIADAVKDILARPEKVKEVRETARAMVTERYDWDTVSIDMQKLFSRMLG